MKAAVFRDPGKIECRTDVADPQAGPGEVLVRVEACGICGSDLHLYRTNAHRGPSLLRVTPEGYEVPGHEYSGVIVKTGRDVRGWHVGERVVGVTGGGAFAELVPVPVNPYQLARMPANVSFEEAATTEPLADALQMVRLATIEPGEHVAQSRTVHVRRGAQQQTAAARRCVASFQMADLGLLHVPSSG